MQENKNGDIEQGVSQDTSLAKLVFNIRDWTKYFLSKWYIIVLVGIIGGALGLLYATIKKPVYTATTSFVLEGSGGRGPLNAYAGIASSALGIDLGFGAGGGLFEGENILELYRSRSMITRALLSPGKFDEKEHLLIDRFITFNKLRDKWKTEELKNIQFNTTNIYGNKRQQLLHDSIIAQIVNTIDKQYLQINRVSKKSSIINVVVKSKDEAFAKELNQSLVRNVNDYYLQTKTKKSLENVSILQQKTDSVRQALTGAIYRATTVSDATPNQNLTRMTQRIAPVQNAEVNAQVNKVILEELVKNLELGKISLRKETPLIQIVDEPILPLAKEKLGRLLGIVLGGIIGVFFITLFLALKRMLQNSLS